MWVVISKDLASSFKGRDVISTKDFSREELELVFEVTEEIEKNVENHPENYDGMLRGKRISLLFYESSTRTYDSFKAAIGILGGRDPLGFREPTQSSVKKGESFVDTIRAYDMYGHAICLRHYAAGAAKLAAEVAKKPVINCGDGNNEHPTQGILDLSTIKKVVGKIDGLKIAVMGDLKYGRTGSSLCYALANYDVELFFVTPPTLKMRDEVKLYLKEKDIKHSEYTNPDDVIPLIDVLYVTRIQEEKFPDKVEYEKVKGAYIVDMKLLEGGKKTLKVMHPLPRIDEVSTDVDESPFQAYFMNEERGPYCRAGLFKLLFGA